MSTELTYVVTSATCISRACLRFKKRDKFATFHFLCCTHSPFTMSSSNNNNNNKTIKVPEHPPLYGVLAGLPIVLQLPAGTYYLFADRPFAMATGRPGFSFCIRTTYFCADPYTTCAEDGAADEAVLKHSCRSCWRLQDFLLHALSRNGFAANLNLVHWGSNAEQHATMARTDSRQRYPHSQRHPFCAVPMAAELLARIQSRWSRWHWLT